MDWKELTIDQIKTMLLDEQYRGPWKKLWTPLRDKNFDEKQKKKSGKAPLSLMTYTLTVVAVWHALSEGTAPDNIDLRYLEDTYFLKDLFWVSEKRSPKYYTFPDYLVKVQDLPLADRCLARIKADYGPEPFQPEMPFAELLGRIDRTENRNIPSLDSLEEVLDAWGIQEKELPPKTPKTSEEEALEKDLKKLLKNLGERPSYSADIPEKGRADIKWDLDHTFASRACDLVEHGVKQFVFTGAPGTGKTYAAQLLAQYLGDLLEPPAWAADAGRRPMPYTLVQFHPSYDYTDFVEGLRPIQQGGGMNFVKMDGAFKAFCRRVEEANRAAAQEKRPAGRYFFIIDEINRAELSKVFGELMYCLETDKRGPDHLVQTQYQNLRTYDWKGEQMLDDVFAGGFFIPENVYLIGTMNDIDRSAESMDFALRRRFNIQEAVVDQRTLLLAFRRMGFGRNTVKLTDRVDRLNQALRSNGAVYGLNRQYFISHGQFGGLPSSIAKDGPVDRILGHVWTYRLETLLREYLRGLDEDKIKKFVRDCQDAFWHEGNEYDSPEG